MKKETYKGAGVDTKEGEKAVNLMKDHVKKTFDKNVLTGLGGFAGLYNLDLTGIEDPVLVSGTDGVGTKLKLAFILGRHDTIGQDCVAMCVNDILCQGAKPLFFLDYIATGKVKAEKVADIVKGVADGCQEAGCALIGGETAEMPGFYSDGEYDIAGFAVGIASREKLITGQKVSEGDVLIGLASSGIHSNGYSLVRKLFEEELKNPKEHMDLCDMLIEPTKIYVKTLENVIDKIDVHGIVHITGGGFYENVPRILPEGLAASLDKNSWPKPEIFEIMGRRVEEKEMFSTFNMGIGMILVLSPDDVDVTMKSLQGQSYLIGKIIKQEGQERVII